MKQRLEVFRTWGLTVCSSLWSLRIHELVDEIMSFLSKSWFCLFSHKNEKVHKYKKF